MKFRQLFEALPRQHATDGDDALRQVLELAAQTPTQNAAEVPEALRGIAEALANASTEAERQAVLEQLRSQLLAADPERAEEIEELLRSLDSGDTADLG